MTNKRRLPDTACLLAAAAVVTAAFVVAPAHAQERESQHWCAVCAAGQSGPFFQPITRWSNTFTNGGGLVQGQHTTITWSLVPDGTTIPAAFPGNGEVTGGSDMIANFDATFGDGGGGPDLTTRPWFWTFQSSFDRWSQLAALDYIYVADDGVEMNNTNAGSATRGDVRIGGHNISGAGSILAYNYYPNRGDMVLDTSDMSVFGNSGSNYVRARNIIAHEHGHGMGIAHTESSSHSFLMEPFLSAAFDGPQFDDILSANRLYGDVLEKNAGNDTPATAYDFGALSQGTDVSIGYDAVDAVVAYTDTSFVSIDDESDVDYYSFTVDDQTGVRIVVRPVGPVYMESAQTGDPTTQSNFYTYALSDLTLTLFDVDGTTVLQSTNARGLGGHELFFEAFDIGGTYYVQVAGLTTNAVQMYQLDLMAGPVPEPASAALLLTGALLLFRRRAA